MKNNFSYSLGFMSYCSHDPAACLVRMDGTGNLDYIHFEEGMISRKKKSYQFPLRAIKACLDHFGIGIEDIDVVTLDYMNQKSFFDTASYYRKLLGDFLRANLAVRSDQLHFIGSHHLAHAYTAFYPSGFEDAAILVIDGLGSEQQTHSIYSASLADGITHVYSQRGTGIGKLYSAITKLLGFGKGEEGKTMGLAPYGALFAQADAELPSLTGNYQGYCVDYSNLMSRLPSSRLHLNISRCKDKADVYSPYYSRLAYNIQQELEKVMLHLSHEIANRLNVKRLCIAGGVGLNCVANELIRKSGLFEDIFVQPASGDSGLCLGLALAGIDELARRSGTKFDWAKQGKRPFWTYAPITFDNSELFSTLKAHDVDIKSADVPVIAASLAEGKIVAYYEGGWEFGPRALGHRSFLADPRSPDMKAVLNGKIKHREGYRPFAPIIMREHFDEYFVSTSDNHPFMLFAVECREKACQDAPTIVHVDNTARVQTCERQAGRIYDVLAAFRKITGVPILVNTSLNDNDEPIVLKPIDALSCFLRTNADVLVVNDLMIFRSDIPDTAQLLRAATSHQRQDILEHTEDAIGHLMQRDLPFEDPVAFLAQELLGSLYAQQLGSRKRATDELVLQRGEGGMRCLVTDCHHQQVLARIAALHKVALPFDEIILLPDDYSALAEIPPNSLVLLYNVSVLMIDPEVSRTYPTLSSCQSFYRPGDVLLGGDAATCGLDKIVDLVVSTYETAADQSIEDFFSDLVVPRFIDYYLGARTG